jgi:type IV pilus assembly protein PilM
MAKYLNIEVGDSFVRICLTEKRKNSVTLKKAFMVETPVGTAADGMITDPGLLGNALTPKLHENGMGKVKNVIFTLISGKVATREVMLPPLKENRIKSVLETNSSEYFPVDISRYLVSYGMLKSDDTGSHMMALAAPLQFLDGYIKLAEKMNLDIQGIDFGGNSQFQVLKALGTKKTIMCVAVTGNHTCITITKGDRMVLQRMLPWGGDDLIESYISAKGDEETDYITALELCSVPLARFLAQGILDEAAISRAFNRIVGGITRSMDFFNSSRWSSPIDDIILAGTCANLAGLRESVSESLHGAEVLPLEEYLGRLPNPALLGNAVMISHYISAYGSAFAPVDMIPEKYKATKERKKSSDNSIIGSVVIFGVCVVAGITMSLSVVFENNRLTEELDDILNDINSIRHIEAESRRYALYSNAMTQFGVLTEATETNNRRLVDFFEEIEAKMPSDMLLMSAVCTNEGVTMNIRVPTLETAAKVITEFHTFDSVNFIETSAITTGQDEAGFLYYTFTINCLYEKPAAPEQHDRAAEAEATEDGED